MIRFVFLFIFAFYQIMNHILNNTSVFPEKMPHKNSSLNAGFLIAFVLTLSCSYAFGQKEFRTRIISSEIKSLEIKPEGEKLSIPCIELGGEKQLEIEFDEMSHEAHAYSYRIIHCNQDWKESVLSSTEFLDGYTTEDISDIENSVGTTVIYTHYRFNLPNDNMNFKISGNYAVLIYEDNKKDEILAQACFTIVEPKVNIDTKIRGNTDLEIMGRLQQLDILIDAGNYKINQPEEITLVVQQNNRFDNQAVITTPTYIRGNILNYTNNRDLIFEGGNEFHNFDISSFYSASEAIENINYKRDIHEVLLKPDHIQTGSYLFHPDVNGKFIINSQEAFENSDTEADYARVHFELKSRPFFDGTLYLGGQMMYNLHGESSRIDYNNQTDSYTKDILLKQGGYNYQYWFLPKGDARASATKVENSYWQANNEYTIYVYHRPWGGRSDLLIGVQNYQP